MSAASPTPSVQGLERTPGAPRALLPALARGWALFGIAVVNVGYFAYPGATGYTAGGLVTAWDRAAYLLVMALFALKSYSLFGFMFGAGFGQQMLGAQRQGQPFGGRYLRRVAGLAVLGVVNVVALFHGDILLVYASLGLLLWLFRDSTPKRLVRWAAGLYTVQCLLLAGLAALLAMWQAFAPEEMAQELARTPELLAEARAGFTAPGFAEVAAHRVRTWADDLPAMLVLQGTGAMAFIMLGLAALRSGLLNDPAHPVWRRCRRVWLPVGLVFSAIGAALLAGAEHMLHPQTMAGMVLLTLASPAASAGYLGLLALWAQRPASPLRDAVARAGSASLSAYLLQGLLLSLVFCGYGLGWYGQAGAAVCVALGASAGAASIAAMSLWRRRFHHGPFEALLRRWTRLGGR
jgi:uncharacterized protein